MKIQPELSARTKQRIAYDSSSNPEYIGTAPPNALTSESKWQIKKLTYNANNLVTQIDFAGGTTNFDKVWDNRTTYTYS
jgi:hypothetical protein